MPEPSCITALAFFEIPTPRFSYHCISSMQGWQVETNGSIHPPSSSRLVEIRLTGYPNPASLAGFQVIDDLTNGFPPNSEPWTTEQDLLNLGITPQPPWPPQAGATVLTLDFKNASTIFYRLAVTTTGGLTYWDDPKIYNDPVG